MRFGRACLVFVVTLGLSFGLMTANALAVKQAFAKPCPMEQMGKKHECPCCKDHCDSATMGCAAKCGPQAGTTADENAYSLDAMKLLRNPRVAQMQDQFAYGPAPPIPIT